MSHAENVESFEISPGEHKSITFISDDGSETTHIVHLIARDGFVMGLSIDGLIEALFTGKNIHDGPTPIKMTTLRFGETTS
jgi:hypothetical protein